MESDFITVILTRYRNLLPVAGFHGKMGQLVVLEFKREKRVRLKPFGERGYCKSHIRLLQLELRHGSGGSLGARCSAQLVADEFTDCNHFVEADIVLDAEAIQQVDHILGGHISGSSFGIWASAQARHR